MKAITELGIPEGQDPHHVVQELTKGKGIYSARVTSGQFMKIEYDNRVLKEHEILLAIGVITGSVSLPLLQLKLSMDKRSN